jgi:hypothetical protein
MIIKTQSFQSSDGSIHPTIEAAQAAEISVLWKENKLLTIPLDCPQWIVENREKIADILTTTATSKVKARRINGGSKTRKSKTDLAPQSIATEVKP